MVSWNVRLKAKWFYIYTITLWNSTLQDVMDATSLQAVEGELDKYLEEIY